MLKFSEIYNSIINYGIKDDGDFDIKRSFRQVNEFNFFLCLISFSAWPIAVIYEVYQGLFIQITGFCLYLVGFRFVRQEKLKTARKLAIYTFETHMFVISSFALIPTGTGLLPWYSPVFEAFILYPLVAALFDKPIFKHMGIALLQIVTLQFVGYLLSDTFFKPFPYEKHDILNIIISIYTLGMATLIVYLIYSENRKVKELEKNRSYELEKTLTRVKATNEMINNQAEELLKINDSKNKFFSLVAHDLKSPYNTVLGFSEILKDMSKDDPEYNQYASNLYDLALHNFNLLENLLGWARSQMDHVMFTPRNLCLNDLISSAIKLLAVQTEYKNVTIRNKIDNTLYVFADQDLVSIILRNLLSNAIKYSHYGGTITLSATNGKEYTDISVKDEGIGMSEEILKTLFSIETKSNRKGTASETGTGLGLILCKEFVEMHQCRIWVESTENKGSTFYFNLPLGREKTGPEPDQEIRTSPSLLNN